VFAAGGLRLSCYNDFVSHNKADMATTVSKASKAALPAQVKKASKTTPRTPAAKRKLAAPLLGDYRPESNVRVYVTWHTNQKDKNRRTLAVRYKKSASGEVLLFGDLNFLAMNAYLHALFLTPFPHDKLPPGELLLDGKDWGALAEAWMRNAITPMWDGSAAPFNLARRRHGGVAVSHWELELARISRAA
jgi:hypothetical protein